MALFKRKHITKCVDDFANNVVKQSRANLKSENANASGTLSRSIGYRFEKSAFWKKAKLSFVMEKYGAWLDQGVSGTGKLWYNNGKYLPVAYNKSDSDYSFKSTTKVIGGSLKDWLRVKGLDESLDYVVRRSVAAKGIRPRRFFTYAFNSELAKFDTCLGNAINRDIDDYLDNILKT
jgi:hypothetical protein